jgi:hypothetical protein
VKWWCEHCRDHFDENHYPEPYGPHKVGPAYGPTGQALVFAQMARMVIGEDATLWPPTASAPRTFEVRRDGKHFGFVEVTDAGEVVWVG